MGCDIHVHIEVKKDGIWYHYGTPELERNYILFALIDGVRMDCLRDGERPKTMPLAKIHGLPDDATFVTKVCFEQDKGRGIHNIGVLAAEDLPALQKQLYELLPEYNRLSLDLEHGIFRTYVNGDALSSHDGWDDLRIVFWFDN